MIKLKYKRQTYYIPNNLNELIIKDFQKIKSLKSDTTTIQKIKYMFDLPDELIKTMRSKQIRDISNSFLLMINSTNVPLIKEFTIDSVDYMLDNKLDELRYDQWSDLNIYTANEEIVIKNFHIICSILYRPFTIQKQKFNLFKFWKKRKMIKLIEEYDSSKVMDRADIFQQKLTTDVAYGLFFFMLTLKLKSINNTLQSLLEKEKKEMKQMKK